MIKLIRISIKETSGIWKHGLKSVFKIFKNQVLNTCVIEKKCGWASLVCIQFVSFLVGLVDFEVGL